MLNIVVGYQILLEFKKSRYFKINLGLVSTVEKNGSRAYNKKDQFSFLYNNRYKTTIYGQGNIGDVKFYLDHYIKDTGFVVYSNDFEEFIFEFDYSILRKKGIDFYIGHIFKIAEEEYERRVIKGELAKDEPVSVGNSDNILNNPGNVSYADLQDYLRDISKKRYN
jgi:hypothetical protein